MSGPKVVIGTVHPDLIDAYFCRALADTLTDDFHGYLPFRGRVMMARAPAGMIHVARNAVVADFLRHPLQPKYLLFIDTDMAWTPDQAWDLIESAEAHDLPAVNALVCLQSLDPTAVGAYVMKDYDWNTVTPTQEIQQVFCAGMAFMLLRRDGLEACYRAHAGPLPWFDYGVRRGTPCTEEVIFSQRYHDLGIPIHVNTQIRVGHRKIHTFIPQDPAVSSMAAAYGAATPHPIEGEQSWHQ
jgi:hypothetical protein